MQILLGLIGLITFLSILVMFPSALASWYSKCLDIQLKYGFALVFSFAILMVILNTIGVPPNVKTVLFGMLSIAMSAVIIYGVYRQFTGKCNLGK